MRHWGRRWRLEREALIGPPSPIARLNALSGLRRDSLRSLHHETGYRACRAVAREASEGWWSQAGSNRRPLACHASALPAELWPLKTTGGLGDAPGSTVNHSSRIISSVLYQVS